MKKKWIEKYDHSNDDLEPLTKETGKGLKQEAMQPDVIENNLFNKR